MQGVADEAQCPICGRLLYQSDQGVNAHLRKHVREGRLQEEDRMELRLTMLQRRFIDWETFKAQREAFEHA